MQGLAMKEEAKHQKVKLNREERLVEDNKFKAFQKIS